MKKLLFVVVVFAFSTTINAQNKAMKSSGTTFGIAGNVGFGTYTGSKLVAGGDLQVDMPVGAGLKITFSGGYENFSSSYSYTIGSTTYTSSGHASFIPLLAGAKFNLSTNLYGHAQLGYSLSTVSGGTGAFTYAPSIGYVLSQNFDVSVKYFGLTRSGSTLGGVVARLAYNF